MKRKSVSLLSSSHEISRTNRDGALGIIAGSGPEAGVDLWTKILNGRRTQADSDYRGDVDAPSIRICSLPALGLSMDMDRHADALRPIVREIATEMASRCVAYTIACNTLHFFADELSNIEGGNFISVQSIVRQELHSRRQKKFALLGASPVMSLGEWSPYSDLKNEFEIEIANSSILDDMIYAVKAEGGSTPELSRDFKTLVESLKSEIVVVGCTELPLLMNQRMQTKHQLVDVTTLLADAMLDELYSPLRIRESEEKTDANT